jgi:hypothetical protein
VFTFFIVSLPHRLTATPSNCHTESIRIFEERTHSQQLRLLTIIFLLITARLVGQSNYEWSVGVGGVATDAGYDVFFDNAGNVYNAGIFLDSVDFDGGSNELNLFSPGSFDIYISKHDALGNFLWVKQIGGTFNQFVTEMIQDAQGNILITGTFEGTVDFDPSDGINSVTSQGGRDIFLVKLDADGNFIYAKTYGGIGADTGMAIDLDAQGKIYITGTFENTCSFESQSISSVSGDFTDVFVLKLNANGTVQWVKQIGGPMSDNVYSMDIDSNGNVFIAGKFSGDDFDFDPSSNSFLMDAVGTYSGYAVKLSPAGDLTWAKALHSEGLVAFQTINVDSNNDIVIGGQFEGVTDFDFGTNSFELLSSEGSVNDLFFLKTSNDGDFIWAKTILSAGEFFMDVSDVAIDVFDNIYATGRYTGPTDFNPSAQEYILTNEDAAYLLKLSDIGNFIWARSYGISGSSKGKGIDADDQFGVVFTGDFSVAVDFDLNSKAGIHTGTNAPDVFICKLDFTCAPSSGTAVITACDSYTWINGVTYTSNNSSDTFTVINSFGCDSLVTLNLTFIPTPTLDAIVNGNTINASLSGWEYEWFDCNNASWVADETQQSFSPSASGSYSAQATQSGCTVSSDCVDITLIGVEELTSSELYMHPNPASDRVFVASNNVIRTVELIESTGRIVLNEEGIYSNQFSLDLNSLDSGMYILRTTDVMGEIIIRNLVVASLH